MILVKHDFTQHVCEKTHYSRHNILLHRLLIQDNSYYDSSESERGHLFIRILLHREDAEKKCTLSHVHLVDLIGTYIL